MSESGRPSMMRARAASRATRVHSLAVVCACREDTIRNSRIRCKDTVRQLCCCAWPCASGTLAKHLQSRGAVLSLQR